MKATIQIGDIDSGYLAELTNEEASQLFGSGWWADFWRGVHDGLADSR
ncbi:MAG: hypothetical protein V7L21_04590 [Nostoc sp.]|nr:hypothetical protein [Nostoc sp. NMS9]MBN3942782.1 hypothetical protein [Nostoc sp. NMS9]